MALKLRVRPRARADMLDIWNYVAAESERSADKVLGRIGEVFDLLVRQPEAGRRRPELAEGLRSLPAGTYVVFYQVTDRSIEIVRVINGYRDIADDLIDE